jgi:ubiquinone/menaquinone biosynthesis C-methylase UbiE
MGHTSYKPHRKHVLSQASGNILEIGFGTGQNLGFYPSHVRKISTVDINPGMSKLAMQRASQHNIQVIPHVLKKDRLPFENNSFDTVVSTWTLCSVGHIDPALKEVFRVLKPGGKFLFLEHGLSSDMSVQLFQHFLTPVWFILAGGCHLNRNMYKLLQDSDLMVSDIQRFYIRNIPKFGGYMYQGVAVKK